MNNESRSRGHEHFTWPVRRRDLNPPEEKAKSGVPVQGVGCRGAEVQGLSPGPGLSGSSHPFSSSSAYKARVVIHRCLP